MQVELAPTADLHMRTWDVAYLRNFRGLPLCDISTQKAVQCTSLNEAPGDCWHRFMRDKKAMRP